MSKHPLPQQPRRSTYPLLWRSLQVLLALLLIIYAVATTRRPMNHDQFEVIHTAWKMPQGERMYIDFFQHHHPLTYWLVVPVLWLTGDQIQALGILSGLFFGLMLLNLRLAYLLALLVLRDRFYALIAVLLSASFFHFQFYGWEIRPDILQVSFGLAALYGLLHWQQHGQAKWLYGSGIFLGLSLLSLQKAAFLVAGIGLWQLYWLMAGRMTLKLGIRFWLCFAIPLLPVAAWFGWRGELGEVFFLNWTLNAHFLQRFSPWGNILSTMKYNAPLWLAFVAGAMLWRQPLLRTLALIAMVLLLGTLVVSAPHPQYFLMFGMVMSILAAAGCQRFLPDQRASFLLVLAALAMPVFIAGRFWFDDKSLQQRQRQMDALAYVLEQTEPTDVVLDGTIDYNLFRKDADYFWFSIVPEKGLDSYRALRFYPFDLNPVIAEKKPRIINSRVLPDSILPVVLRHYRPSEKFPELLIRQP